MDLTVSTTPDCNARLAGKVAIVSGSGSRSDAADVIGTGAATARLFAKAGARIVVVDRDQRSGTETMEAICADGGSAIFQLADLNSEEDCASVVSATVAAFGGVDILVNNAAVTSGVAIEQMTAVEWARVLDVNLRGAMLLTKGCIPLMASCGGGAIVNICSVSALRGFFTPAYAAAKGGMLALTIDLAVSEGPKGIRVNAVVPGHVYTPMVRLYDSSTRGRDLRRKANPLGTEGTGWDVAWAALFLAGSESRWITGAALPVDGGLLVSAPLAMFPALQSVAL